jgi:hypothetical protein
MTFTKFLISLSIVGAFLLSGCITSRHPAGIAPSTTPISGDYIPLGNVEEISCSSWFLIFPLGGKESAHTIIAKLIQEKGADSLVGVTVEQSQSLLFLPIAGQECTTVKGQAVRISS